MNIAGIVSEYNPFHNGHQYQLNQVKKSCDAIVCVMSGSFVQRGDIAIVDKWTRAKMALSGGADLVLELPVCYSLNTAEHFSYGAVYILNSLGIVNTLCFGSESGDIDSLTHAAETLDNETPEISLKIKRYLDEGLCYPSARERAFSSFIPMEILSMPNNILGVEYIRALRALKSSIVPKTIKRYKTNHDENSTCGNFASASAIRDKIKQNEDFQSFMPKPAYEIIKDEAVPYDITRLDAAVSVLLRTINPNILKNINDVSEGLENRLIKAARQFDSFYAIAKGAKTKRYTLARIRRVILSALLGLTSNMGKFPPQYVKVLGMSQNGQKILSAAKKHCPIPIITKNADFDKNNFMFKKDVLATDIFALCCPDEKKRFAGQDFITSPIIWN
ncbi:MAG: nucleotidyltransferase [Clostridia bacterium]|nr:nucleotidyltransferase [Clostridia bacterium]